MNSEKICGVMTILIGVILGCLYIGNIIQTGSMELAGMGKWTGIFVVQVMTCFFLGYIQYMVSDLK